MSADTGTGNPALATREKGARYAEPVHEAPALRPMEAVEAGAADVGVCVAAIRGSNHCGALFYFAMQALPASIRSFAHSAMNSP